MSEHDRQFSPSASARWIECTASVPLTAGMHGTSSKAAAEGTFAHAMFERILNSTIAWKARNSPMVGITEGEVEGHEFVFDTDMAGHLDEAADWVDALGEGLLFTETKVALTIRYGADGEHERVITGTSDVTVQPDAEPGVLHVCDLKYGQGVKVYAQDNTQMMLYGAATLETHAALIEDIHTVVLHVLQPRLNHHDEWRISVPDLMDWVQGPVTSAVAAVMLERNLAFAPSTKTCQWCPAAPCDAALNKASAMFEGVDAEVVEQSDGDALGDFLAKVPFFTMVAKKATEAATDRLKSNEPVKGFKLVEGKGGGRTWTDEAQAQALMLAEGYDPFTEPKLISVAAAERLYGKKQFVETELVELTQKPKGNPTLTSIEDKRPALQFAPVTFDDVPGEDDE